MPTPILGPSDDTPQERRRPKMCLPTKGQYVFLELLSRSMNALNLQWADRRLVEYLLCECLRFRGRWFAFINDLVRKGWLIPISGKTERWAMAPFRFMDIRSLPGENCFLPMDSKKFKAMISRLQR